MPNAEKIVCVDCALIEMTGGKPPYCPLHLAEAQLKNAQEREKKYHARWISKLTALNTTYKQLKETEAKLEGAEARLKAQTTCATGFSKALDIERAKLRKVREDCEKTIKHKPNLENGQAFYDYSRGLHVQAEGILQIIGEKQGGK